MTAAPFTVSRQLFRALVRADEYDVTGPLGAARLSKTLLLLRQLVIDHSSPEFLAAWSCLSALDRVAPAVLRDVLRYPAVGSALITGPVATEEAAADLLGRIAAAAAVRAGVAAELTFSSADGLVLPSLGRVVFPTAETGRVDFRSDGRRATFRRASAEVVVPSDAHRTRGGWRGLVRVQARHRGRSWTVLIDQDLTGPGTRLSAAESGRWSARIIAGWARLVERHPAAAREVAATVRAIGPMPDLRSPLSATRADSYGGLLTTLPADAVACALTLVHECQHSKLIGFVDLVPLVVPGATELFYAPWRDDPRPARGLLHGLYAHVGVAGFWLRERGFADDVASARRADVEYLRWRGACLAASATLLDSGLLTDAGRRLVDSIVSEMDGWPAGEVVPGSLDAARRFDLDHHVRWRRAHDVAG